MRNWLCEPLTVGLLLSLPLSLSLWAATAFPYNASLIIQAFRPKTQQFQIRSTTRRRRCSWTNFDVACQLSLSSSPPCAPTQLCSYRCSLSFRARKLSLLWPRYSAACRRHLGRERIINTFFTAFKRHPTTFHTPSPSLSIFSFFSPSLVSLSFVLLSPS